MAPGTAKVELLKRIPLFAQCSKSDLQRVAAIAEEIDFEAGTLLMREDEEGHEVFVVVTGQLEVWRRREGGQIAELGPGAVIGEMALLSKKPRNATVRAATPVRLLRITDTDFLTLLDQKPELWLKVASGLADRVPDEEKQLFYHD
jgi:CRP-like cAMP-binding protein